MRFSVLTVGVFMVSLAFTGPASFAQVPVQLPGLKIQFDLSVFDDNGLYGAPDGLRAAAYEFCIPAREDLAAEVSAIDPTVEIHSGSPGRIGCTSDEYLCIGSTYQPGFRAVLANLAQLPYVMRIKLSFGE